MLLQIDATIQYILGKQKERLYYKDLEGDTIYPIEIKKGISPNNPDKNFAVLNKYSNSVATGIVICLANKLQPINKSCWLCPVTLL